MPSTLFGHILAYIEDEIALSKEAHVNAVEWKNYSDTSQTIAWFASHENMPTFTSSDEAYLTTICLDCIIQSNGELRDAAVKLFNHHMHESDKPLICASTTLL